MKRIIIISCLTLIFSGCSDPSTDTQSKALNTHKKASFDKEAWIKATEWLPNKDKTTISEFFKNVGDTNTPQQKAFFISRGYNVQDNEGNNYFMYSVLSYENYFDNHGNSIVSKNLDVALDNNLDVNSKNSNGDTLLTLIYQLHKISTIKGKGKKYLSTIENLATKVIDAGGEVNPNSKYADYSFKAKSQAIVDSYLADYILNGSEEGANYAKSFLSRNGLRNSLEYIDRKGWYSYTIESGTTDYEQYGKENFRELMKVFYKKGTEFKKRGDWEFTNSALDLFNYMQSKNMTELQIEQFSDEIYDKFS